MVINLISSKLVRPRFILPGMIVEVAVVEATVRMSLLRRRPPSTTPPSRHCFYSSLSGLATSPKNRLSPSVRDLSRRQELFVFSISSLLRHGGWDCIVDDWNHLANLQVDETTRFAHIFFSPSGGDISGSTATGATTKAAGSNFSITILGHRYKSSPKLAGET